MRKGIFLFLFIALIIMGTLTVYAESTSISVDLESVTITGNISTGEGKEISVYITDSNGKTVFEKQLISETNGYFKVVFCVENYLPEGKYDVTIYGTDVKTPAKLSFEYKKTPKDGENENLSTVIVECVQNKEYNFVTTIENMPINDSGQYTITYDPTKLELIDLCSLTYKKELDPGVISGTNITIISVDKANGKIVFKNPNHITNNISKVLNSFRFKGLISDAQTILTIE